MSEEALVSVVVPSFNTERTKLERTIDSVLAQTHTNNEIFIVDDGSKEAFAGLERAPKYQGSNVHWLPLQENRGVSSARNAGIRQARGDYIAFLDAGDWWEPRKLELQLGVFAAEKEIALVYCGAIFHPNDGSKRWKELRRLPDDPFRELLIRQPITGSASAVLVRLDILKRVGFFETEIEIPEDRDLWLRIARGRQFSVVDDYLVNIEVDIKSRSASPVEKKAPYRDFLKRYEKDLIEAGVRGQAYSHYYAVIGKKYLEHNNYLSGLVSYFLSFKESPVFFVRGILRLLRRL